MIDGERVVAIVPARAGSQRLPGKNLRPLAGRPMIEWTLEAGLASALIDRLVVSTDDAAVAASARDMRLEVVDRPAELAGPEASVIDAIDHALTALEEAPAYVVLLQPTSPLRRVEDIDGAIRLCAERGAPAVFGVSTLPKPPAFYGRVGADGVYARADPAEGQAVVINGAVYVGRPERLRVDRTFQSPGALAWIMPPERGWDVDTAEEFAVAEALWPLVGLRPPASVR